MEERTVEPADHDCKSTIDTKNEVVLKVRVRKMIFLRRWKRDSNSSKREREKDNGIDTAALLSAELCGASFRTL